MQIVNITRRELQSYFNSPIAYCFIVVFLLVTCGLYMTTFFLAGSASMRPFFSSLPVVLIVFVPAITMRLWAEERKSHTISLLFSLPVSSMSLVLGKFIAALIFSSTALLSTIVIPFMLFTIGSPDIGPIIGGYLGGILLLSLLLSLGMALSAFFKEQIVSFIITLVVGFGCYLVGIEFISAFIDGWLPGVGTFLNETLGISSHFNSFAKGVIDIGDLLFFISFSCLFLIINIYTLEGYLRMRAVKTFMLGCIILIGIGVFFNGIIRDMNLGRIDLTEDKIFTVSSATKRVFERLTVPIRVTYYVSPKEKLPTPMKDIERDVTDMLEELSRLSSRFTYKVVHPEDVPEEIEEIKKKGIVPFSAQTIEEDSFNIKRIYSSISVGYLDKKEEVIHQVVPASLNNLEYELVSKIYRLTLEKNPKIALFTPSSPVDPRLKMLMARSGRTPNEQDNFSRIRAMLEAQGYEVVNTSISKESPIPHDARLLMVIAPERLSERQRYEIYRFLLSGRPVFIASQAFTYAYSDGPDGLEVHAQKNASDTNKLLSPFGITIDDSMFFDTRHITLSITTQRQIGMFMALVQTPVNYPNQIEVLPDQMNKSLSITNSLSGLLYLWGSPIDINDDKLQELSIKKTILFTSSKEAWKRAYHFGPLSEDDFNPNSVNPKGASSTKQYPLSALFEGKFPNPFKGKPVPKWNESDNSTKEADAIGKDTAPSRLFVIGCSEMFSDTAIMAMGNAVFLLNAVDALSLGDELIYIRNKTQGQRFIRPLSVKEKLLWRIIAVFLAPSIWICYGIARAMRRRKRRIRCE